MAHRTVRQRERPQEAVVQEGDAFPPSPRQESWNGHYLEHLIHIASEAILLVDAEQRIRMFNRGAELIFGYRAEEAIGQPLDLLLPQAFRESHRHHVAAFLTGPMATLLHDERQNIQGRRRDGSEFPAEASITKCGEQGCAVILRDITERKMLEAQRAAHLAQVMLAQEALKRANARLSELAHRDGLTGLYNHRAFQEKLREEFQRAKRYGTSLSLIMADVDAFKQYNDTFGHPAGDEVLVKVATILQNTVRTVDYVARYGGEEFATLLPNTEEEGARLLAERLRSRLEAVRWTNRPITASFGVATVPPTVSKGAHLLSMADEALYHAKRTGRNRVSLASALAPAEAVVRDPAREASVV